MKTEIIEINMNTFTGSIPAGFEIVEYETGTNPVDGRILTDEEIEALYIASRSAKSGAVRLGLSFIKIS